jgi:hypothetical protein
VAGTKIRDINPRMGEADDPEKWCDISEAVNKMSVAGLAEQTLSQNLSKQNLRFKIPYLPFTARLKSIGKRARKGRAAGLSASALPRSSTQS